MVYVGLFGYKFYVCVSTKLILMGIINSFISLMKGHDMCKLAPESHLQFQNYSITIKIC
jgi:hypothetical protein